MSENKVVLSRWTMRYAIALFELARDGGVLDIVWNDLQSFLTLLDNDSNGLSRLFVSPVFSADDRDRIILSIHSIVSFNGLTANFLRLVARRRRASGMRDIISAFSTIYASHIGEMRVDIVSAYALSDHQLVGIETIISKAFGNKKIRLSSMIDPCLLGGLVIKMGSRMIDASLRTKLDTLGLAMKEVG